MKKIETKKGIGIVKMVILGFIYMAAGYWATGKTIYRNRIIITTASNMFLSRLIWGTLLGFILIPWAIFAR